MANAHTPQLSMMVTHKSDPNHHEGADVFSFFILTINLLVRGIVFLLKRLLCTPARAAQ